MTYQDTIREYRRKIRIAAGREEPRLLLDFTGIPHDVLLSENQPHILDVTTHSSAWPEQARLFDTGGTIEVTAHGVSTDFMHMITKAFTSRTAVDIRVTLGVVLGQKLNTTYYRCYITGFKTIVPIGGALVVFLEITWGGQTTP